MSKCCNNNQLNRITKIASILKPVSEPNRLKILCLLKNGSLCVCQIIEALKLPQNLVSHHLAVLKKNNLISSKREGVKIYYQLKNKELSNLISSLNHYLKI